MPVSELVLRLRLISGERLDVTYDGFAGDDPDQALEHAIASVADDSGVLRCRHGDRTVVVFARGVVAIEVGPRGAVL